MDGFLLYLEVVLDLAAIMLGIMLVVKARDNRMKFWWGVITVLIGMILLWNIVVCVIDYKSSNYPPEQYSILVTKNIIEWFALAIPFSLFPLGSLRPGYLTKLKLVVFSIPILSGILVSICYYMFNGSITPLHSINDVAENIGNIDVKFRLAILVMAIIIPATYFFVPFFGDLRSARRKATNTMWIYICSMSIELGYFIMFNLFIGDFIYYTYGFALIIFLLYYSVIFLLYENPFSSHVQTIDKSIITKDTLACILYTKMSEYFENNHPFLNRDYSVEDLAREINAKQSLIIDAIQYGGFTGFREYINFLRVVHFRNLARANRSKSIKELMNDSGFSSRSSFYRIFASYENITPSKYIEKLYYE